MPKLATAFSIAAVSIAAIAAAPIDTARADSCWNHNGSIMRLKASGDRRWFYYENPKPSMQRTGVTRGTLLFDGRKSGNFYEGTARRFSRFCPGAPMEYHVGGPVRGDQLQVTLHGTYDEHEQCYPTGNVKSDRMVFTFAYDC